ncbi:MAG: HAMP domain-containing histidine kinase [Bacteroidia bacterium]|nr:HAMP domain-containing histidine kinase [Bacteroidia bacterium]
MNIYQQKLVWKLLLLLAALLIVVASVVYTNSVVKKIAHDERNKVQIWAQALQKKANLIQYTQSLFEKLAQEEQKKVGLWAKATEHLASSSIDAGNLGFVFDVIRNNQTVPVLLTDEKLNIISSINFDSSVANNPILLQRELNTIRQNMSPIVIKVTPTRRNYIYYKDSRLFAELKYTMNDLIQSFISEIVSNSASVPVVLIDSVSQAVVTSGNVDTTVLNNTTKRIALLASMREQHTPLTVSINAATHYVYYEESQLLKELRYFPYIQFFIIGLFLFAAYYLFSVSRKAEQNQVWVGMSKETAHQLGTPISSLMAWVELLKLQDTDAQTVYEIEKDVLRLQAVADRFSKVGSSPDLKLAPVAKALTHSLEYMKKRVSTKVDFTYNIAVDTDTQVMLNIPLLDWVLENVINNAVDAMDAVGTLCITATEQLTTICIDIEDTGKGIPANKLSTVFAPGFTTKKRGWGLGLSLAKRIVEEYHKGKIFIKDSVIDKGTTVRIVLNKN